MSVYFFFNKLSFSWDINESNCVLPCTEDPVAIAEPCCPDSMTKFLLDVFHDTSTSTMFYTTDLMVLIDIVTRQLTDLCQGDEVGLCVW